MNENIKKYIAIIASIIVVFCTLYSCGQIVNAEIPQSQIVQSHNASWTGYPFNFTLGGKYYTVVDSTNIPTSTYLNPKFFYTTDGIVFDSIDGKELYTTVLNKNIGIILKDAFLSTIYNSFTTVINILDSSNNRYLQGGLYDNNNNFLGYCLNDISGCYYQENSTTQIAVTNDFSNDVYNHFNYYNDNNKTYDYFTFYPLSNSYIFDNLQTGLTYDQNAIETVNNSDICYALYVNTQHKTKLYGSYNADDNKVTIYPDSKFIVAASALGFDQFYETYCDEYELLGTEFINTTNTISCSFYIYDENNNQITTATKLNMVNNTSESITVTYNPLTFGNNYHFMPFNNDMITCYRSLDVVSNIKNETYSNDYYYTDSYNQYSTSNDNSFTIGVQTVDNSLNYNYSIYQDSNDSFYNNYDNGVINTNNIVNNTTNITNNYYGNGNDPDNPDNPEDPDNPDNPTLDAILAAILRFFNAIGDIIGTLLASIINLIDSVLEALSGVIENLTGASDLFASVFAWIPEPVPQILGAGFGICLVCGIIKFIRG